MTSTINEPNIDGMAALHIASVKGNLELVKFLVEEKNADIHIKTPRIETSYLACQLKDNTVIKEGVYIEGAKSVIDFSVERLDLNMTIYFLELGLEMPKVLTIFSGATDSKNFKTGSEFCKQLCDYFQKKTEQNPEDVKFNNILKQVKAIKEDFYKNTLGPLVGNSTKQCLNEKIEPVVEEEKDNYTTDLIGGDNV